jgi:hypothetical protein
MLGKQLPNPPAMEDRSTIVLEHQWSTMLREGSFQSSIHSIFIRWTVHQMMPELKTGVLIL